MPLRFGIRKAKRYDVSTKNSYIVCVHLLDSVLIECTLNTDSTGQDCLENISSRIGLNEIQYFGLRFTNKKTPTLRWVDLDKPLKKQLDKYAQSPMLYFGVMFCIGDVTQIQDEMSRYQYYLYLKTEIIDGRLQCTPEHAILLAAYGVQAELGDYNREMHGNDYLNNMVLLPQNLSAEDHVVRQLTCEIASMHQQLQGFPPATAKLHYIQLAQELEGYGLEYYPVKDTAGKELLLGTSFVGIFVKPLSGNQPTVYFKWSDIVNFSNSKRQLGIDTKLSDKPFFFLLENAEFAKYVYKMCCRQQRFYKANSHLQATPSTDEREGEGCGVHLGEDNTAYAIPDLQQDVLSSTANEMNPTNTSLNEYLQSVNNSTNTVIINENSSDEHMRASLHQLHLVGTELPPGTSVQGPGMHGTSIQTLGMHGSNVPITEIYQHDLPPGMSCVYGVQPVRSEHGLVQSVGLTRLPSYRPPPDYKTIMSHKPDHLAQQAMQQRSTTAHLTQDVLAYSQPDIHQMPLEYVTYYNNGHTYIDRPFYNVVEGGPTYQPTRPVDRTSSLIVYPSGVRRDDRQPYHLGNRISALEHPVYVGMGGELLDYQPSRPVDRSSSLMVYPSLVGRDGVVYSRIENVPDVAAMLQYRQPPPYGRQSTSTPDLALQMANAVSHSTPDLATCHARPQLIMQSRFDQSLENLALDAQQLQFCQLRSNQSRDNVNSSSGSRAEVSRVTGQREVNRSTGHVEVNRATGQMEVNRSTGEVDVNQPSGLFEANRSAHLPFPDVTKNGAADTNATGRNVLGVSVDLSRLAMLQHFEKQNRVILQKMAENPSVGRDDYLKQLRLQEDFRNIQINTTKSEGVKQLPKSVEETRRLCTGDNRDFQQKSNGSASPVGHSSDCSDGLGVPVERLTGSQRSDNGKAPVVGSAMMQKAAVNTGNVEIRQLTENAGMINQRGGGGAEMEADPKGPNDESRQTLESKLEDGQVFVEFEQVPKKRQKFDCSTALSDVNRDRNRFKDVIPYEDNRVKLKPTKENPTGYINASHIRVQVGKQEFSYIATQGPLANTVIDFWQMIYENNIRVISMLTGVNDPDQRKCAKYWPVRLGTENALKFGDFSVALRYINECWSYVTRGLIVRHDPSRTERLVWHLQYTEWPDRGCPSNPSGFLEYLDELSAIKRQVMMEQNTQKPACVVVHCSAGVGRTGVLVLTEMMKTIMEHNGNVDVPSALKMLRNQRMHMVQTVSQYSFVYKMIKLYFQSSRLI